VIGDLLIALVISPCQELVMLLVP